MFWWCTDCSLSDLASVISSFVRSKFWCLMRSNRPGKMATIQIFQHLWQNKDCLNLGTSPWGFICQVCICLLYITIISALSLQGNASSTPLASLSGKWKRELAVKRLSIRLQLGNWLNYLRKLVHNALPGRINKLHDVRSTAVGIKHWPVMPVGNDAKGWDVNAGYILLEWSVTNSKKIYPFSRMCPVKTREASAGDVW